MKDNNRSFAHCPNCSCNEAGVKIVRCNDTDCRTICCEVCSEDYDLFVCPNCEEILNGENHFKPGEYVKSVSQWLVIGTISE